MSYRCPRQGCQKEAAPEHVTVVRKMVKVEQTSSMGQSYSKNLVWEEQYFWSCRCWNCENTWTVPM